MYLEDETKSHFTPNCGIAEVGAFLMHMPPIAGRHLKMLEFFLFRCPAGLVASTEVKFIV